MEECVHTDKYEGDMSQSSSDHGNQVKNYVNISDNCGRSIQYPEDDLLCKESEDHLLPTSGLMTTKNKNEAESNMKGQQMNSNFSHSVDIQHRTDIRDTKGHICSICGSTLSCRSSLDKHVLIHTSKKPYHCAVCGQPLAAKDHVQSVKLPEGQSDISDNMERTSIPEEAGPFWNSMVAAGMLFVCETCVACRNFFEAQETSVHKWMARRQNEPLHVRLQRLERERTAKRLKRANESADEREMRRLRDREAKRLQRMQESEDQRARRLQREREAMRLKRANETPEKRQARLVREREAKRIKRHLQKLNPSLSVHISQKSTPEMSSFQLHVACPNL
ncbi:zinc finger protein 821-like isoform X1 [Stegostoma tigrinum]|uniref:zinc finger protein 821-like isoform X1 n=1 Tax=Stegostoma tigrinum TaxID=3053191 RepID=UPI00202ACB05|nr:zinc finger protein 821-like isoform X1 [Stegostoma tigrinum]XP_048402539.1 zinc finger protein 821-like isoform X1 [Stegostoma tigrinum]XP_048402540.1 zinc finger protein 821-like isoform X1 [Stegostoma tigrinum]XP_048402541.1 zinc finger protein 821-like isoform X1 [Stegostoma tigrinum]XP_048402542.1 zinc finger protein 821-like isoform X1 [Stegostoma tigrinum]XP_048402543.1 zinc finger protein 821-like isoform X1 [Stegostoma tigrinum]XP_059507710.1 zinc finger protein 821-like isoform X